MFFEDELKKMTELHCGKIEAFIRLSGLLKTHIKAYKLIHSFSLFNLCEINDIAPNELDLRLSDKLECFHIENCIENINPIECTSLFRAIDISDIIW